MVSVADPRLLLSLVAQPATFFVAEDMCIEEMSLFQIKKLWRMNEEIDDD